MMMMRNCTFLALLAAVALVPSTTEAVCSSTDTDDIFSLACATANAAKFSTLCDLLTTTDVGDEISTTDDWIVFAPTNDAFVKAGSTTGSLKRQQRAVLQYHVYSNPGNVALGCGQQIDSQLTWNFVDQTSITECSGSTYLSQNGDVKLPNRNSGFATFTETNNDFITACNGKIFSLNDVMGFDRVQYNWQPRCNFLDPTCIGGKGGKAGGFYVNDETVNDITFESIFFNYPKGSKGGFRRFNNNQFNQQPFNNQRGRPFRGSKAGGRGWWRQLETNDADAYDGGYDYAAAASRAQYADEAEDY